MLQTEKETIKYVKQDIIHPPVPAPLLLNDIDFTVSNGMFCMSAEAYEDMAENIQELRRYINEANNLIIYYRAVLPNDPSDTE